LLYILRYFSDRSSEGAIAAPGTAVPRVRAAVRVRVSSAHLCALWHRVSSVVRRGISNIRAEDYRDDRPPGLRTERMPHLAPSPPSVESWFGMRIPRVPWDHMPMHHPQLPSHRSCTTKSRTAHTHPFRSAFQTCDACTPKRQHAVQACAQPARRLSTMLLTRLLAPRRPPPRPRRQQRPRRRRRPQPPPSRPWPYGERAHPRPTRPG